MNEREANLRRAVLDAEAQESRVRAAREALIDGKARLTQTYNTEVHKLEEDVRQEEIKLRRDRVNVCELKAVVERGFEE